MMNSSQVISHVKMKLVSNVLEIETASKTLDAKSIFTWLTAKDDFMMTMIPKRN
jgi:hypothetical protein